MWGFVKRHAFTAIGVVAGAVGFAAGGPAGVAVAGIAVTAASSYISKRKADQLKAGAAAGAAGARVVKGAIDAGEKR